MVARNGLIQNDVQLRYYLHIDPDVLTDEEWAMQVKSLEWIRKQEAKER